MTHSDQKMHILGATGKQGGAVARHLLAQGFTNVHALARTTESPNARLLTEQGITLALGDLDDRTAPSWRRRYKMPTAFFLFCPSIRSARRRKSGAAKTWPRRPNRPRCGISSTAQLAWRIAMRAWRTSSPNLSSKNTSVRSGYTPVLCARQP
jgi:hypothetical protein